MKIKIIFTYFIIIFIAFPFICFASTDFFSLLPSARKANLPRDILQVSLDNSFSQSYHFYDSLGNFLEVTDLTYYNNFTTLSIDYGITDHFSMGINIPLAFRKISKTAGYSTIGLADVYFDLFYEVLNLEDPTTSIAVYVCPKFPSGSTSSSINGETQLPLGNGQIEIGAGLRIKQQFLEYFAAQVTSLYTYKFAAIAEYLKISITDSTGSYDIGNRKIDFGDDIDTRLDLMFSPIKQLNLQVSGRFIYNFKTKIDDSYIPYISTAIDTNAGSTDSQGYILSIIPKIVYAPIKNIEIFVQNEIPLMGTRYPVAYISEVVSLSGMLDVSAGFNFYFD
ncbi:MAG: hypothetical protein ABIA04_00195 [Pseudomonadota bacterium]